ncbi:ZYRO0E01848p [Zygosaccharomyces rouxii]|uniref:ZYRO0E01848p n=1 Tax=Zygosaccharomyces rouxii (strain ATCC 2623 / CBS 732 / NBRC 1130 / NCYC 568 / NRRL Y-229) TaxID=559307 RepID=C5E411_ZYGRC|nr:uncharacterized protein ZYRO0E01848g [Zygosaccharomyces rouxii]KAH9198367.1 hypothetical protein LQ764DRAFT_158805 [Zygosaccharomyces rouxii]CAR30772.1 ZYRO0E01848p [Zygosaccharomyces rouxii]
MGSDGFKTSRDNVYGSGGSAKNTSIGNSDVGSIGSRTSRESTGSHRDKMRGEISKLQEEIASVKGDDLQDLMSNKDKSVSSSSTISPKPSRRRNMHPTDFNDTKSSKLNQVQSMDTIDSDAFDNTESSSDNNTNNNNNDNEDKDFGLTPAFSIHGNTSKVAANLHRRRVVDWNMLPRLGSSVLVKHQSFNVINIPIDGELKQILYTPSYNENFKPMNIFLSFNMDSKSKEAQLYSKKRLNSFGAYIGHYLKSRLYAYQRFPFYQQDAPIDRNYASYDASKDYSEIETVISLWYMQSQRCISQSNSTFFSADVVQHLLQRKANTRHQASQPTAIYVPQTGATLMTSKPSMIETTDDIDILLLRPYQEARLGWQLAYDEPNLKIADYPIDVSPWMMDESDTRAVLGSDNSKSTSSMVNIVNDEAELVEVTNENAGRYLLDCMGRRSGSLYMDEMSSPITKGFGQTPGNEVTPTNSLDSSADRESPSSSAYPEPSRKKVASKLGKKTGLSSLFKRKHQAPTTPSAGSSSAAAAAASAATSSSSSATKKDHPTTDGQGHPVENAWLESYFSRYLSNYKRIDLPTQFLLPKEAQDTPKTTSSSTSNNQDISDSRNALLYSKESLQLRLPFADDSIPAIFCPRVWMGLAFNKWRNLLREMHRVLLPGGYALASVIDIGILNSFASATDESMQEFPTTQERDRILDAISLAAIEKGVHIHPTQHLAQAFKDVGFTNLRYSVLSLKTGDCATEMGCLYEIYSEITWDLLFRKFLPDPTAPPKGTDPTTLFRRFIKEHMGKVDDTAGSLKVLYLVAQKAR